MDANNFRHTIGFGIRHFSNRQLSLLEVTRPILMLQIMLLVSKQWSLVTIGDTDKECWPEFQSLWYRYFLWF